MKSATLAEEIWGDREGGRTHSTARGEQRRRRADLSPFAWSRTSAAARRCSTRTGRPRDAEIYFVANQRPQEVVTTAAFRVREHGAGAVVARVRHHRASRRVYDVGDEVTHVPLQLGPQGSVFVVFRRRPVDERPDRPGAAQWRDDPRCAHAPARAPAVDGLSGRGGGRARQLHAGTVGTADGRYDFARGGQYRRRRAGRAAQ